MEHALNLVLTVLVLGQFAFLVWITAVCRGKIRDLQTTLRAIITPTGPEEASPLASVVDVGADMVARAVTARIKTSLMGSQSGQVRQEKAVERGLGHGQVR